MKIRYGTAVGIGIMHLIACLIVVPAFFSWTFFWSSFLGYWFFGVLGINIGYHRLLSHGSFQCSKWLEYLLAMCGCCCLQGSPGQFVVTHRKHHAFPDEQGDPHSAVPPSGNFLWAHFWWLTKDNGHVRTLEETIYWGKDIYRDPFYRFLDRYWMLVFVAHAVLLTVPTGIVYGWAVGFGAFVWTVALRTVIIWHATWSVNSFAHLFGSQPNAVRGNARNNLAVAVVANGEGWHNNHHAKPSSARHGWYWYQIDTSWYMIWLMKQAKLVWEVNAYQVDSKEFPKA